jgi:hypothetical protein
MQALEFHFNPKDKKSISIDSFVFEPENESEKRLGGLYLAGKVSNSMPQEKNLLEELSETIKKEYYYDLQKSPESSLKQSIKKANEFLDRQTKKGLVGWIGNLDFALMSIFPLKINISEEETEPILGINFVQTGKIKILLIREKEILDISQDVRNDELKAYPSKTFENIVSGKLIPGDKIIITNKNIYEYFKEKDLIRSFIKSKDKKAINEVFKSKRKELLEFSGFCLFLMTDKEIKEKKKIKVFPSFSLKKFFPKTPSLPKLNFKLPSIKKESLPRINKIRRPSLFKNIKLPPNLKEKIVPVLLLVLLLLFSSFLFKEEKRKDFKENKEIIELAEAEKAQAENFLVFKDEKQANLKFQSAWIKIDNLFQENKSLDPVLQKEATELKESIEESLFDLNNVEKIEEPELITEIFQKETNLIPQKITSLNNFLFFSNPYSNNLYEFDLGEKEGNITNFNGNIKMATFSQNSLLFFLNPNIVVQYFPENEEKKEFKLSEDSINSNFRSPATYGSNIYFLNPNEGEIIKYSLNNEEEIQGNNWLDPETGKTPRKGKSMAIDGDVWILTDNFKIDRYYQGFFTKSLEINIFPLLKNPTKIFTSPNINRIYILEPSNKRVIIMTKHGEVVKQYSSDKFNNLLDISVSKNEEQIYLLNGIKVYKIDL